MWEKLFKKLDRMSGEMETLSQGQAKINKRYVSMWKIVKMFIIFIICFIIKKYYTGLMSSKLNGR